MKVGIIGCGAIANIIASTIVPEDNNIDIEYFYDNDVERAENLASFANGVAVLDLNDMLDKVDLVLECASPDSVKEHAPNVLSHGIDMIIMSIGTYIFGLTTDSLVFAEMDYKAWILSVAISLIITLGAVPLFQVGVRCEGASTAGIVSAFEPITSIILGAIFLGETMGLVQYIGGGLIILGVVLAEKYG